MGKGDRKTKKGKRTIGSYGVSRPRKKSNSTLSSASKTKRTAAKPARKKAIPKAKAIPQVEEIPVVEETVPVAEQAEEITQETSQEAPKAEVTIEEAPLKEANTKETPKEDAPQEVVVVTEAPKAEKKKKTPAKKPAAKKKTPAKKTAPSASASQPLKLASERGKATGNTRKKKVAAKK